MIVDKIDNGLVYRGLGVSIQASLEYLSKLNVHSLKKGVHEIPEMGIK